MDDLLAQVEGVGFHWQHQPNDYLSLTVPYLVTNCYKVRKAIAKNLDFMMIGETVEDKSQAWSGLSE